MAVKEHLKMLTLVTIQFIQIVKSVMQILVTNAMEPDTKNVCGVVAIQEMKMTKANVHTAI